MVKATNVSKTPVQQSGSDLMQRAVQSTANLGWIQDYLMDWQTIRSLAIRIASKQNQQATKDEAAYEALLGFIALAGNKVEQLEEAYTSRYSAHERLMIKVNEANGND